MPDLPARFAAIIVAFAPLFRHRTWRHAEILLVGAILAPGKRTVTSILRITGLSRERHFVNYHRVLNRARWNSRRAAHLLLGLLIHTFVPAGPVILGLDDTIERRRGKRISSQRHLPRPGALIRRSLRQGVRSALDQPHAPGPDPVGGPHLGSAVPDRLGALRAVLP